MDTPTELAPLPASPVAATCPERTAAASSPAPDAGHRDDAENAALARLIGAVATGDGKALEQLYARSVARVYALALRIAQRPETAEEVVADVYVQVWQSARTFDPRRGSPLAWLVTICRSRALDARRRADPALLFADSCELLDAAGAAAGSAHDPAEASQSRAAVQRAIAGLTAPQRQLLGLAFFRGLSHAELAQQLGLPLGTVKSQMRQALGELRRAMRRDDPAGPAVGSAACGGPMGTGSSSIHAAPTALEGGRMCGPDRPAEGGAGRGPATPAGARRTARDRSRRDSGPVTPVPM